MAKSADSDQLASSEAIWSGSTLFVKVGHIRVQQDKGKGNQMINSEPFGLCASFLPAVYKQDMIL